METCSATRKDGSPCTARALQGRPYCFAHDPALAARRRRANAEGGRNKASTRRLAKLTPASLRPVLEVLFDALEGLQDGTVEPRTATAMASVAGAIVRVYEVGEMEARLRALEENHDQKAG